MNPAPIDIKNNRLLLGFATTRFCAFLCNDFGMDLCGVCTDLLAVHTREEGEGSKGSCQSMHLEDSNNGENDEEVNGYRAEEQI